jgi:septal ring factor EnvC (AmiA/AmiB activator)
MDTIRKETAAEIIRTRDDMMALQMQIMKTEEKLKKLEAALNKVEDNFGHAKKNLKN